MTDKTKDRLIYIFARFWQGVVLLTFIAGLTRHKGLMFIVLCISIALILGLILWLVITSIRNPRYRIEK